MSKEQEKFEALRKNEDIKFWGNRNPMCPHCGKEVCIQQHELYELYKEGTHSVDCPFCELEFDVVSECEYRFNTDDQDDMED